MGTITNDVFGKFHYYTLQVVKVYVRYDHVRNLFTINTVITLESLLRFGRLLKGTDCSITLCELLKKGL
jgi:hypothetical protein